MEKKSTSKASKASKNTKATVSNSKKSAAKELLFAGKVARKSNFKTSKWSVVEDSGREFTEEEIEAIHSIRLFSATDKKTGDEYWFIKVMFEEKGEMYEISFTPDLKLVDKGQHGDYLDPKSFFWYKLTDGEQEIERARGKILMNKRKDDDMPY